MAKSESNKKTSTTKKTTTSTKKNSETVKEVKKETPRVVEEKKEPSKVTTIVQEENHFGRTILAAVLILIIFLGGYLGIKYKLNSGEAKEYVATKDEEKFKEAYESLNGTTRSNGQKNKDVTIPKENHVVYIDTKKAAEILDNGSGVIYFGFASCPWCRNVAPILVDAAIASDLDTIYYVDVRPDDKAENDIRDTYVLDERNKPVMSKEADSSYYDILLYLANDLEDYTLTTDSGKKVSTGERRLFAPTVVAVKDGIVVGFHEGSVEGHIKDETGALRDLTKDEVDTVFNIYSGIIGKYLGSGCQEDGC